MKAIIALVLVASVYCQTDPNDQTIINPPECGQRPLGLRFNHGKVVGGEVAKVGDWNWMVLLMRDGSFICGGSLINSKWVLTAAHCTTNLAATRFSVKLGLHNRAQQESWVRTVTADKLVQHAEYGSVTKRNDIALLRLSTAVQYNTYIGPTCICSKTDNYLGTYGWATGWGTLYSGGPVSNELRQVNLLVRKDEDCEREAGSAFIHTPTMVCAGEIDDGKDTCQGDSGGPLVAQQSNGRYCQLGVTSWGVGCGKVGVYARVQNYNDWILNGIKA